MKHNLKSRYLSVSFIPNELKFMEENKHLALVSCGYSTIAYKTINLVSVFSFPKCHKQHLCVIMIVIINLLEKVFVPLVVAFN